MNWQFVQNLEIEGLFSTDCNSLNEGDIAWEEIKFFRLHFSAFKTAPVV